MDVYRIAFIGHYKIQGQLPMMERIEAVLREKLRGKEFAELYVGRDSDFDFLAALAAKKVQGEFCSSNSRLILLQPYPKKNDSDYDRLYDNFQYLVNDKSHPEATVTERNRWMVDHADLLVAYVETKRKCEALATLRYAEKKGVEIINLAMQEQ